jgi:hypothetical protein
MREAGISVAAPSKLNVEGVRGGRTSWIVRLGPDWELNGGIWSTVRRDQKDVEENVRTRR